MRKTTTFLPALALGVAGVVSAAAPSLASPITYTETVTATGSLGGKPFTSATVMLTMTNDTTNVSGSPPSLFNVQLTPLVLNVTGFPTETFTDTTQAAVNQTPTSPLSPISPNAGFGDNGVGKGILLTQSNSFMNYDLMNFIGPISGSAVINAGTAFPTTDGNFILNSVAGNATFTAAVPVPVPAPGSLASLVLLGMGLAGVELIRRRRRS
jgi:hypothetical protein